MDKHTTESKTKTQDLKKIVKKLPRNPGVYKFLNSQRKIIYVGKAKNLRSRVGSYFLNNLDKQSKTYSLVTRINDIQYIEVQSELEALILEAELIKKHHPKYNINLKDDKSYLYIVIRPEKVTINGKKINLPIVITERKPNLKKSDIVFGPYASAYTAKYILKTLRKSLPFRNCTLAKFNRYQKLERPCLFGHIGLCQAPCTDKITPQDYKKDIKKIERFLKGDSSRLIKSLEKQMSIASTNMDYEEAAKYRDIIEKFEYIRQSFRSPEEYMENPYLVNDIRSQALEELVEILPNLQNLPKRIECYDIATISGKDAVGSMVVAIDGKIEKSQYRRFKIKHKDTLDDVGMLREVIKRRLSRELPKTTSQKKFKRWGTPDLIILDGGKGQLSVISDLMDEIDFHVPVTGLAKRYETLVVKTPEKNFTEISLDKNNEGLKLAIRLRDEAHRFAQSYHHKLREKNLISI